MEIRDILRNTLDILWKSGDMLKSGKEMQVSSKSQGNFVTSVDYSMEQYFMEALHKLLPEAGFISEESDPLYRKVNWVIDPIDGTGNMITGFPFSMSLALVDSDGNALLGAVLDVAKNIIFYATPGGGAFSQAYGKVPEKMQVKRHSENEGLCIFGMPYNRKKAHQILSIAETLYTISSDLKRIGPSSLDICAVAEGRAKIYAELDLNQWDYCAGELILKEAGGAIGRYRDLMVFCESEPVREQVMALVQREYANDEADDFEEYVRAKKNSREWIRYQDLMNSRPEQFAENPMLMIETDLRTICEYERAHNKIIGVRFCNEPYSMMVVDLVKDANGEYKSYERVLPCVPCGAVVCVTIWDGKYVLLRQFRHSMREYQICFPRGYGESDRTAEENAKKEVKEELGAEVTCCKKLGEVVANSGLSGDRVAVFLCELASAPVLDKGYEEIRNFIYCTEDELQKLVADGSINDGFTLSALKLMPKR